MTNSHFTFTIRTLAHIPHMHSILSPHIYNTPHTLTSHIHVLLTTLHQAAVDEDSLPILSHPTYSSPVHS